jgi:hypothetical protein
MSPVDPGAMHHSIDDESDEPECRRVVYPLLTNISKINIVLVTVKVCKLFTVPKIRLFIFDDDAKGCAEEVCETLSDLRVGGEEHLLQYVLLLPDPLDEPHASQCVRLVHRYQFVNQGHKLLSVLQLQDDILGQDRGQLDGFQPHIHVVRKLVGSNRGVEDIRVSFVQKDLHILLIIVSLQADGSRCVGQATQSLSFCQSLGLFLLVSYVIDVKLGELTMHFVLVRI